MLVREGDERNDTLDLWLACSLAAVAGALNAAAFYAVGFFSANMTGNVSTVSARLALGQWFTALFYFTVLLAFICGAACSACLINVGRRRTRRIYAYAILVEAIVLMGVALADLYAPTQSHVAAVVLSLAFAMGFQNAIGTRISGARIRTTHISGLATDIGIEMAAALQTLRPSNTAQGDGFGVGKLRLQLCTVLCFMAGGVLGVVLYRAAGGYLFMLAAATLFGIGVATIVGPRHPGISSGAILGGQGGA